MTTHRIADATQTVAQFFRHLDDSDYEALGSLLLSDGVWHRQGEELVGPQMAKAALAPRSKTRRIAHLLTNLYAVPVDENVADVTGYMLVVQHDTGAMPTGPLPLAGIDNIRTLRARLVATDAGWRVARMASEPVLFDRTA
jgi:ketosteroid isomerase-like protein